MIQELHHIGIAVPSLDEALPRWTEAMGLRLEGIEEVPGDRVRIAILWAGGTRIELLEPTAPDSPVARFLDKRGPGLHHLAFKVDDCGEQLRVLADAGAALIDEQPRGGAHDWQVGFVHPKWLLGVLAEMVEDRA